MASRNPGPWIALLAAAVAGGALWFFWPRTAPAPAPVAEAPPVAATPTPMPEPPAPTYPVEQIPVDPILPAIELPALEASDAGFLDALAGVFAQSRDYLVGEFVIPRLVATIDNLPKRSLTRQIYVARPATGELHIADADGRQWLDAGNAARYDGAVEAFMRSDSRQLVSLYVQWYPLFERAWRELGESDRRFNDRLVEVVDHLLAAPEISGPIELRRDPNRPRWIYADPEREAASVGHKALLRLGPDHAARVKAKLREVRALLAGTPLQEPGNAL
ncbi:DUF3014 domain-containing protein [Arenimonas composti]|uniref:DUF3014 domain-containing protein n=1 Tax=Arenimonas composti TR7-09 = DSM 18010 TaxID=1121013 RepID=A0A091B876_9GAMM|nr:DUF3014 domain-containing protein [Arenimonas composti]KFN47717.1 hypothetical protein P873_14530 [Arenimonas composti TR7-09 = DSM 18010]